MENILYILLLIVGVMVGWIVGGFELKASTTTIKSKSLLSYLLGK